MIRATTVLTIGSCVLAGALSSTPLSLRDFQDPQATQPAVDSVPREIQTALDAVWEPLRKQATKCAKLELKADVAKQKSDAAFAASLKDASQLSKAQDAMNAFTAAVSAHGQCLDTLDEQKVKHDTTAKAQATGATKEQVNAAWKVWLNGLTKSDKH